MTSTLNTDDLPNKQTAEGSLPLNFRNAILKRVVYLLVFCASAFVLSIFAEQHWIADLIANLRAQAMIGTLCCGLVALLCRQWKWSLLALALLLVQIPWFLPSHSANLGNSSNTRALKVTTVNVLTHNRRHDDIVNFLVSTDSDVIAILELSSPLRDRLETDAVFSKSHPHSISRPQDNGNFGIGLYSRFPLDDAKLFALYIESIESIEATITVEEQSFRIVATHPLPPVGARNFKFRNDHLDLLTKRLDDYQSENPDVPLVVIGDLNLTPWSPIFSKFANANSLRRVSASFPAEPTWHVKFQVFPFGLALDHILVSKDLKTGSFEVGPDIGSDHRAVTAEISK